MEAGRMLTAVNTMRESLLVLNSNDIAGFGALREVKQAVESTQQVAVLLRAASGLSHLIRLFMKRSRSHCMPMCISRIRTLGAELGRTYPRSVTKKS